MSVKSLSYFEFAIYDNCADTRRRVVGKRCSTGVLPTENVTQRDARVLRPMGQPRFAWILLAVLAQLAFES